MSERELLRKFYFGLYKINCKGHIACPLYDENLAENNQLCDFSIENQNDRLNDEEFDFLWSHVRAVHQTTYENILDICRSKASKMANDNQSMKIYDLIGSTVANLTKLTTSWTHSYINSEEFLVQFRSELESLDMKVKVVANSMSSSSNAASDGPSLPKL